MREKGRQLPATLAASSPHPEVPQAMQPSQQREKAGLPGLVPGGFSSPVPGGLGSRAAAFPLLFGLAGSQSWLGLHLTTSGRRDPAWGQRTQCCTSVQKHSLVPMVSTTPSSLCVAVALQRSLVWGSRKILGQRQPRWECWEENAAEFGCGGEGASWGGLEGCMPLQGGLSQALVPLSSGGDAGAFLQP